MSSLLNRWKLNQDLGINNEIENTDGEFSKGVGRAWENTKATTKAAIGAMGAEDFLIAADFNQHAAQKYAPKVGRFTDIDSLSDAGNWLAGTAGESVVDIGTILAGGGMGGVAARSAAKMLGSTALKSATRAGTIGGLVASNYPQQFGEDIQAVRAEHGGTLPEGSVPTMALTAVAQTALDTLPVMGVLGKLGLADKARGDILQKTLTSPTRIRQIGRDLGGIALKEGATEAAQEAMKLGALEWIDSNKDHFGVEQMKQLVDSFAAGAVGGAIMGAPVAGLNALHSDKPWFRQKEAMKAEAIKRFEESGDAEQFAVDKEAIRSFTDEQLGAETVQSPVEIAPPAPVPVTPATTIPEQKLAIQPTVNPMEEAASIQSDAPVVVDPVEVAKPNDSPMGFEQGFKDLAGAISDNFYKQAFDAVSTNQATLSGVKDPVLARAKPYFEAGLINSPNDLRQFENQGYPELPMPKAVIPEAAQIAAEKVIPLENLSYEQNTNAQKPLESTEIGQGIPEPRVDDAAILGDLPINNASPLSSPSSFTPTHELADGTPVVAHPEDAGIWVAKDGSEYEGSQAYPVQVSSDPSLVQHQKLIDQYQADTAKVEQSASEAALSPLNDLSEPSLVQKEAGNLTSGNKTKDVSLPDTDAGIREREALKKQEKMFNEYQSIRDSLIEADAVDEMRRLNEGYRLRRGVLWPDYMSSLDEYNDMRGGGFTEADLVRDRFNVIMREGSRAAIVEAANDVGIKLGGSAPIDVTNGNTTNQAVRGNQPSVLGLVDAAFEQGKKVVVVAGDAASARLLAGEGVLVVKHLSIAQKKLVGVKRLVLDGVSPEQVAKNQRLKQLRGEGMQLVLVSQQPAREMESRLRGIC
jgi:hypothetical protein